MATPAARPALADPESSSVPDAALAPPAPATTTPAIASPATGNDHEVFEKDFGFLPIPKYLRYDPKRPAHFGLVLNATFGFAGTFSG